MLYNGNMPNVEGDIWYHNISESYYYIQLTIKCRKPLFDEKTEKIKLDIIKGFKARYAM